MRRLIVWIASTAAGVVLLFSYSTSTSGPGGHRLVTGLAPVGVVPETPGPAATSAPTLGPAAPAVHAPVAASPVPTAAPPAARATAPAQRAQGPAPAASARPAASPAAPSQPKATPAPQQTTATTRTINGAPADTRYGPVQVQIKMSGTRIVSSNAIVYPTDSRRDQEINSQAIPQLNDETVRAQSANIDTVSGATYTSDGYQASLQSALDAAHQ